MIVFNDQIDVAYGQIKEYAAAGVRHCSFSRLLLLLLPSHRLTDALVDCDALRRAKRC